tara:strand:+ start:345 stop:710 length:366 start_codon:yes stop_codon:yes gene_type:complete
VNQLRWRVLPLLIWTLLVWISRGRNVLINDELTAQGLIIRLAIVIIFLTLAAIVLIQGLLKTDIKGPLAFLAAWSIAYWLIRGGDILIDSQWSIGFKAIHTVLMFGTFALVALALRKPKLS